MVELMKFAEDESAETVSVIENGNCSIPKDLHHLIGASSTMVLAEALTAIAREADIDQSSS